MNTRENQTARVAVLGLFAAITVVLQMVSYFIHVGPFNLTLVLIPIVVAAVLYGPKYGAYMGLAFGMAVAASAVAGLDGGGHILFNASPVATLGICLVKGVACGAAAGGVAKLCGAHRTLGTVLAAVTAPVVNTGLFLAAMLTLFRPTLYEWAGGTNVVTYILFGLVGANFLIELAVNVILTPTVLRVLKTVKKI